MAVSPQHHAALGLQFRERADANELVAYVTHSRPPMAGSESIVAEAAAGEDRVGRVEIAASRSSASRATLPRWWRCGGALAAQVHDMGTAPLPGLATAIGCSF